MKYTQSGLISTTANVSVLVVLIFSQNFSTNGPYVVLNFCKFSDTWSLFFEKNLIVPVLIHISQIQQDRFLFFNIFIFVQERNQTLYQMKNIEKVKDTY